MSKRRSTTSAGMTALSEMVPTFERARYGSVAPDDFRRPLVEVSHLARQIRGDEAGQTPERVYGLLLLLLLTAARREGESVPMVLNAAGIIAATCAIESDAVLARAADDGMRAAAESHE